MIKDMAMREISRFDPHRTYIINASFVEKQNLDQERQGQPVFFVSTMKKRNIQGFWVLKKTLTEDNAYPYQILLLKEAQKIEGGNGILVDELNDIRLITIVKNGIPISTYISLEEDWRPQAIRLAASNNLQTDESLVISYVSSYWTSAWKKATPFLLIEEWESQKKRFPISSEIIIFILVLVGVCYYGFETYNDMTEKRELQQRISTLEKEKQNLQQTLNKYPVNVNLEQFYKFHKDTEAILRLLKRLQAVSPTSVILKVDGNKIVIDKFAPNIKDELQEYHPKITPQGVELTWK